MDLDLEAFMLMWRIKYGNTDTARQKVMSGKEIKNYKRLERWERMLWL